MVPYKKNAFFMCVKVAVGSGEFSALQNIVAVHRIYIEYDFAKRKGILLNPLEILARATGLEPVTYGLTAKEQFGIIGLCSADSAALQYLTHIGSMAAYNLCQQSYKSNSMHTKHIVISALISYLISGLISMLISHLISSPISVLIIVLISKLISEKTPQISHLIS